MYVFSLQRYDFLLKFETFLYNFRATPPFFNIC